MKDEDICNFEGTGTRAPKALVYAYDDFEQMIWRTTGAYERVLEREG